LPPIGNPTSDNIASIKITKPKPNKFSHDCITHILTHAITDQCTHLQTNSIPHNISALAIANNNRSVKVPISSPNDIDPDAFPNHLWSLKVSHNFRADEIPLQRSH
jgi:hypothetical protein